MTYHAWLIRCSSSGAARDVVTAVNGGRLGSTDVDGETVANATTIDGFAHVLITCPTAALRAENGLDALGARSIHVGQGEGVPGPSTWLPDDRIACFLLGGR